MTASQKIPLTAMCICLFVWALPASAAPTPNQRHEAGGTKTGRYFADGFFAGGERTVTSARLKDIRRAKQSGGYERIVLDLEPQSQADEKDVLPYFQIQAAPQEGRFIVSIWANVAYELDLVRVTRQFAKSAHFKKVNLMPRNEEGLTIIEFTLAQPGAKKPKFEVFHLARPARIIMDVI